MTSVCVKAVSKSFGGHAVLRGVDLAAPDRGVLALLGPSGCGKTTLLRIIAGFERADAGKVNLGDRIVDDIAHRVPPERRRIGYVSQDGSLFPHLTVAGNVAYGLPRRQRKGTRVGQILDLVGLTQLADRYPHQLSGGQQQRVALARALAPEPAVVLLDEPFNALDLELRRRMCEEVVTLLRRTGTTAILVTHDPGEAFATADLVAVMQDGAIMQCGPPDTVYRIPANPTVARLTGPAIFLEGVLKDNGIETPLGTLPLLRRNGSAVRMVAMLRPEQIVPGHGPEGRKAAVIDRRFRGDHTVLTVAGDGFQLDIRSHEYSGERTVYLHVTGGCVAFPSEA
jgi:iron(III) transport system ATP-binding protein